MTEDKKIKTQKTLDDAITAVRNQQPDKATVETARDRVWMNLRGTAALPEIASGVSIHGCADVEALLPAYRAQQLLRDSGYQAVPVNPAFDDIAGERCYASIRDVPQPIDTVTLYLGEARSTPLAEEIIAAKPRRIIMNPGAENDTLAVKAAAAGIEVVQDCTLVMLRSGAF